MRILMEIAAISPAMTGDSYVVVLKEGDGDRVMSIIIGPVEANAIVMCINGTQPERPLTHDLLHQMLVRLDVSVKHVCIREFNDGVFKADIILDKSEEGLLAIDSRSSDALAVAVRMECPIFVDSTVLDVVGESPMEPGAPIGITSGEPTRSRDMIQEDLQKALENEDYEEAAKLRDILSGKE